MPTVTTPPTCCTACRSPTPTATSRTRIRRPHPGVRRRPERRVTAVSRGPGRTGDCSELATALLTAPRRGVPWERGGRYFVIANPGELDQDQLFTAASLEQLLDIADPAAGPEHVVRRRHGRDDGRAGQPGRPVPGVRAVRGGLGLADHPGPGRGHRQRPAGRAALDQVDRPDLAAGRVRISLLALPGAGRRGVHRGDGRRRADAAPARRRPGRRRGGLVAAGRARVDGRSLGLAGRPLAGADQSARAPTRGRPWRRAGWLSDAEWPPDRRRRGWCRWSAIDRRAPCRRIRRRHAVPAHRTGRPARPAGRRRPGGTGRADWTDIVGQHDTDVLVDARAGGRRFRADSGRPTRRTGSRSSTGTALRSARRIFRRRSR